MAHNAQDLDNLRKWVFDIFDTDGFGALPKAPNH